MAVRVNASSVVYLPSIVDERFLHTVVETLERMKAESEVRGHPFLASLLDIAQGEAADEVRTHLLVERQKPALPEDDGGAALMAKKFARRARA